MPTSSGSIAGRLRERMRGWAAARGAYAAYLQAVHGRRGLPWNVNGEWIRIDPRLRHFIPHASEPDLFSFLRATIRPGDLVLDIGAFLGVYAILEARWAGPTGRVLAFEPSPLSFDRLQRHLDLNRITAPRVAARRAAVGATSGRRGLVVFDDEPYKNKVASADGPEGLLKVDVVTVDDICRTLDRPPDLIRMDVQGFEFEVLAGARHTLEAGRGRMTIVAEMHLDEWRAYGTTPDDVPARLEALGLRARPLVAGGSVYEHGTHAVFEYL
jgi:FkbM family methyltransferase